MNKKRPNLRPCHPRTEKELGTASKKHGFTLSGLATHCMNNRKIIFSKSYEQNVISSMKENYDINGLLQNSNLSDKTKDTIVKEMKKYV